MASSRKLWALFTGQKICNDRIKIGKCFYSAWVKCAESTSETQQTGGGNIDVERLFTRNDIQSLLKRLTGFDLEGKLFRNRKISNVQRSHYALMTDEAYLKMITSMQDIGENFLQFVPVLEPRCSTPLILAKDPEIEGFDDSKYIFTDLSFGLDTQIRAVVVRETDGTLRSATSEERDRMMRVYKGHPYRPVFEPSLFRDPYLQMALDKDDHEYVLDWACHYYLPNDPVFIKLCHTIYDRTVDAKKFRNLHSTRHFGPFVFYLVLNKNFTSLLNYYAAEEKIEDAANLIRLIKAIFPDKTSCLQMEDADDLSVLQNYAKDNLESVDAIRNLIEAALRKRKENKEDDVMKGNATMEDEKNETQYASIMDKESFANTDGPLGEMAKDYSVRVVRGSIEAAEQLQKLSRKSQKHKNRNQKKNSKK